MSAFGRSRRQVWLSGELVELLKVASDHEKLSPEVLALPECTEREVKDWPEKHTMETLLHVIVQNWFEQPEKVRYAELLKMRNAAREAADREWKESLDKPKQEGLIR